MYTWILYLIITSGSGVTTDQFTFDTETQCEDAATEMVITDNPDISMEYSCVKTNLRITTVQRYEVPRHNNHNYNNQNIKPTYRRN